MRNNDSSTSICCAQSLTNYPSLQHSGVHLYSYSYLASCDVRVVRFGPVYNFQSLVRLPELIRHLQYLIIFVIGSGGAQRVVRSCSVCVIALGSYKCGFCVYETAVSDSLMERRIGGSEDPLLYPMLLTIGPI